MCFVVESLWYLKDASTFQLNDQKVSWIPLNMFNFISDNFNAD